MRKVTSLEVVERSVGDGNWDESRKPIDRIILHTMVGTAQSAHERFNIPNEQASAHYGVLLNGTLWHWVDEDNTAYHCGNYPMNQRSIGIEHEDGGDYNGVRPESLYEASVKLVRDICLYYNIPIDRDHILGHREVSATACPDALDIDRIVRDAAKEPEQECRIERDTNWNCFVKLCDTLKIDVNPSDKGGTTNRAVDRINELLREEASTSTPPAEVPQEQAQPQIPPVQPKPEPQIDYFERLVIAIKKFFSKFFNEGIRHD